MAERYVVSYNDTKESTERTDEEILTSSIFPSILLTEQTDEPEVPAPIQFFADNDLLKTKVFGKSYEPDNSRFTYILIDESDSLYVAAR